MYDGYHMAEIRVATSHRNRSTVVATPAESVQNARPKPEFQKQNDVGAERKGFREPRIKIIPHRHNGVQSRDERNASSRERGGAGEQKSETSNSKTDSDRAENNMSDCSLAKVKVKGRAFVRAAKTISCESTSVREGHEFMMKVMKDLKPTVVVDLGDESDDSNCHEIEDGDEVLMWCVSDLPETVTLSDSD